MLTNWRVRAERNPSTLTPGPVYFSLTLSLPYFILLYFFLCWGLLKALLKNHPRCHTVAVVQLTATQASALTDEPVHIQDTGLTPFQIELLWETLEEEKGNLFHSQANYSANEVGEQAPFLAGYYVGVHNMGLLWALKPEKILIRLLKRDVMNNALQVQLKLYDSDIIVTHVAITTPNVSMILERWCVIPGVTRILVKEGCLQGACFLPPGE